MDGRFYLDVISGRRRGVGAGMLRGAMSMATPLYRLAVAGRNGMFDLGGRRIHRIGVPVVSVGNMTTGGTGKTPIVAWLAEWFESRGLRPCLLSRGYRSLDEHGNDERRVLRQLCPGVPHLQDRDRVAAAHRAVQSHAPDVLILDDGFQHRRLFRDADVVLIDALNPWGYGRLLPRGLLREPPSALRRASLIAITRADQCAPDELLRLRQEIRRHTARPIVDVAFRPRYLVSAGGQRTELLSAANWKLFGFCGIGNPEGFEGTLKAAGFVDVPLQRFPDHHHYVADDLRRVQRQARQHAAAALVTTQKDLVKLDPAWDAQLPIWALVIGADVIGGAEALHALLSTVTAKA